jgi:hypothetical protein
MAISIIDNEEFSESGSLTVPEGTTLILAFVEGATTPPKVDGVSMGEIIIHEAESIIPGIGIHEFKNPTVGTLPFTYTGSSANFVYLTAAGYRPGSVHGFGNSGDSLTFDVPTAAGDVIFGIMRGSIGPCSLECDEVEMDYIKNSTLLKIGYAVAGAALITCLASDMGSSGGYYADGGQVWVPAQTTPGYYTYENVWQPGYYVQSTKWVPGRWYTDPYGHVEWIPAHWEPCQVWVPGYWWVDAEWHYPVTVPGHYEDNPDIWVPEGPSQLSACFCSIREYPEANFVSRPIMWG